MRVYDHRGAALHLSGELGRGGEGTVWRISDKPELLAKIYHKRPSPRDIQKHLLLATKAAALARFAALPMGLVYSDQAAKNHVGVLLPYIKGVDIADLYGTRSRLTHFPKANFKFLVYVAYNLAAAFEELHQHDIIVGDVNEQNIKVLSDGTVRFIDSDSFQVRSGSVLYSCDVGTPLWTPPELHGMNLTGQERTENHDLFGLAQLVFLILFAGRNPFAGVPRGNFTLFPEEAIKAHAFAFADSNLGLPLRPPPGAPSFDMIPQSLRNAFLKAFLHDSVKPRARPRAVEWRRLLESLRDELVVCAHNTMHVFWRHASDCPWCSIVRSVGVDLFPGTVSQAGHATFGSNWDDARLLRMLSIQPLRLEVTQPPAGLVLKANPLPQKPTGVFNSIHQWWSPAGWKSSWLLPAIQKQRAVISKTSSEIQSLQRKQQEGIDRYGRAFAGLRQSLDNSVKPLRNLPSVRSEALLAVMESRRQNAMEKHLQSFSIRKSKIPQIGPSRLATLMSFNIETAADISKTSLRRAGLPTNAQEELLYWRATKERHFVYDPNRPLTLTERQEVEIQFQSKLRKLHEDAAKLESQVSLLNASIQEELRPLSAQIFQLEHTRQQAQLDLRVLEQELAAK